MLRTMLFVITLTSSQLVNALTYTLEVSEAQLQEKLMEVMPLSRSHSILTVEINDPKLQLLKGSNEISIFVHVKAFVAGQLQGTGRGRITGSLSYEPTQGAFYFHQPKISELEIDKLQSQFAPQVRQFSQQLISKTMAMYPIYKLDDDDMQQKLAKSVLQAVEVKNQSLILTLNAF
jgi:hypothetical protein